ncbi:MAG: AAA family ATPase [Pseudomonadota bacterium]
MNQRTFLGLTHNPFVPPKEGFYAGADRKTHLDHLRHLSQWSRRILVVTGSFGIGKSTLFKELSASVEPQTMAARIAGTLVNTEREVLAGVTQGFGIAQSKTAGADDLSDLITAHVQEQTDNGRSCLIMADDAHLFESAALQRLVALVAQAELRLVLFAEPSLASAVDRAAKRDELEWYEIRLTGFPKAEVRDYLEWRFAQAQYRGRLPFTDAQLDSLFTKSAGNPGTIDSMASNLLIEMETGELHRQKRGFPALHTALALLLAVLVALVYLFVQPETSLPGNAYEVVVASDPKPLNPAETAAQQPPLPEQSPLSEQSPLTGQIELPGQDEAPQTLQAEVQKAATEDLLSEVVAQTELDKQAEKAAEQERLQEQEAAVPEVAAAQPAPPAPSPPAQISIDTPSEPEPAAEPPPAPTKPAPRPETAASANTSPVPVVEASRSFHDGQWLLRQSADLFTLQLVTLSNRQRAVALINRQPDPSEFAIYELQRAGKRLHVITYGLFSSRAAATAAVSSLNAELQALKPWIRPMRLVQEAVRAAE